ncbi:MAG: helix-turn-helix domain-containing protein [Gammaproteobacteria bacterium]|nr:helix-turn-helix domain-containing protein [Gammaproteobacteria bacterium]
MHFKESKGWLTEEPRYQIQALKKAQNSQVKTAKIIAVSASMIHRELKRNAGQWASTC